MDIKITKSFDEYITGYHYWDCDEPYHRCIVCKYCDYIYCFLEDAAVGDIWGKVEYGDQ